MLKTTWGGVLFRWRWKKNKRVEGPTQYKRNETGKNVSFFFMVNNVENNVGGWFFFRWRWKKKHLEKSLETKPSDATRKPGNSPTLLRRGVAPEKKTDKHALISTLTKVHFIDQTLGPF